MNDNTSALATGQRLQPFDATRFETDSSFTGLEPLNDRFIELHVECKGVVFPMLLNYRAFSRRMVVFGQSALSSRDQLSLPIFHRWSWAEDFPDASFLALSDPTLELDPQLLGGWFQGTPEHFYAETAAVLVRELGAKLGLQPNQIFFYGSSAGGFTSILMAAEIGAHAIAEIPQINMSDYHVGSAVQGLLRNCYGGLTLEQAKRKFGMRMDLVTRLSETKRLPNIVYLQNLADEMHTERHMKPLLGALPKILEDSVELRDRKIQFEFYRNRTPKGDGHVVGPKELSLQAIRRAMREFK